MPVCLFLVVLGVTACTTEPGPQGPIQKLITEQIADSELGCLRLGRLDLPADVKPSDPDSSKFAVLDGLALIAEDMLTGQTGDDYGPEEGLTRYRVADGIRTAAGLRDTICFARPELLDLIGVRELDNDPATFRISFHYRLAEITPWVLEHREAIAEEFGEIQGLDGSSLIGSTTVVNKGDYWGLSGEISAETTAR